MRLPPARAIDKECSATRRLVVKDEGERVTLTLAKVGDVPSEPLDVSHEPFGGGGGRIWNWATGAIVVNTRRDDAIGRSGWFGRDSRTLGGRGDGLVGWDGA